MGFGGTIIQMVGNFTEFRSRPPVALWAKLTLLVLEFVRKMTRELPTKRLREGLEILRPLKAGAVARKLRKP